MHVHNVDTKLVSYFKSLHCFRHPDPASLCGAACRLLNLMILKVFHVEKEIWNLTEKLQRHNTVVEVGAHYSMKGKYLHDMCGVAFSCFVIVKFWNHNRLKPIFNVGLLVDVSQASLCPQLFWHAFGLLVVLSKVSKCIAKYGYWLFKRVSILIFFDCPLWQQVDTCTAVVPTWSHLFQKWTDLDANVLNTQYTSNRHIYQS